MHYLYIEIYIYIYICMYIHIIHSYYMDVCQKHIMPWKSGRKWVQAGVSVTTSQHGNKDLPQLSNGYNVSSRSSCGRQDWMCCKANCGHLITPRRTNILGAGLHFSQPLKAQLQLFPDITLSCQPLRSCNSQVAGPNLRTPNWSLLQENQTETVPNLLLHWLSS